MKKLLALVLALVMSMSLVTISNAAFKDADKISNKEAVDVMAAVGVLAGYDNGEFGATDTLTRAQACKIIAYLDLGGKTADAIKGSGTVFSDVAATAWYAGYVEYCAGAGYVAGIGGGKFDPNANVTGVQFAKMLLCALGYKADVEGYTGADYTIAIARDANKVDLFDALSIVTSAALTREQAAQMAFNALKATVVEYQGGTNVTTSDGTSVIVNATRSEVANDKYDYRVATGYDATTDDTKQQLCEKLYGKDIKLGEGDPDDFGRPSNQWSYKNDDIGTYETSDAVVVYTASTKESVVKADLKNYTLGLKKTGMWVDGKQEATSGADNSAIVTDVYGGSSNKAIEDLTGNGRIVEVYATNKVIDKIVVINAQLAKVSAVSTKNETVTYDFANSSISDITSDVGYGKVAKNDYVMVNVKATNAPTTAAPAVSATVLGVAKATVVTGKITAKETGDNITIAGTKYDIAVNTVSSSFDPAVSNTATVDAYIDTFGYVVDTTANTAAGNYLLVTKAVFSTKDALDNDVYKAQVVKTDGTIEIVTVTNSSGAVGLYSYSVSDGKYTLTAAKATDSAQALEGWEAQKKQEKGYTSPADAVEAVPHTLPALWRAEKIVSRSVKAGFNWDSVDGALDKLDEEAAELRQAVEAGEAVDSPHGVREEIGDALFVLCKIAQMSGVDPEDALHRACDKYQTRFRRVADAADKPLSDYTETEKIALWKQAKNESSSLTR